MRRRWKEIRNTDAFLSKLWRPLPPTKPVADTDPFTSLSSQLRCTGVVFGSSGVPSFCLGRDAATMSLPACVTAI
jgi:hypothetical protein